MTINSFEVQKNSYLDKVRKQAIQKLGKMKRGRPEKIKQRIDLLENLIRETMLDIQTKRKLVGVIRVKHGLEDHEILGEIEKLLSEKKKWK